MIALIKGPMISLETTGEQIGKIKKIAITNRIEEATCYRNVGQPVIRNLSRAGFWREDACCCGAACFAE
jgi:hypothetical protein